MNYTTIQLAHDGAVATITLNRPEKRNAISFDLIDDLLRALDEVAKSDAIVLIVTGRTDCEKSRKVIFRALSNTRYESKAINGWHCASSAKGGSGVYGARCTTEGEKGEDAEGTEKAGGLLPRHVKRG